jgi:hypothetical protein
MLILKAFKCPAQLSFEANSCKLLNQIWLLMLNDARAYPPRVGY